MKRIELPDGQWVDVTERMNHAQRQRIRFAGRDGLDNVTEAVAAMLVNWHVFDQDGGLIGVPKDRPLAGFPASVLDPFPSDLFDDVATAIAEIVTGDPIPKAGAGISPGSAPETPSESTPDSSTPTSSPIIPAGPPTTSKQPLPI